MSIYTSKKLTSIPTRTFWSVIVALFIVCIFISFAHSNKETPTQRAKSISQQLRCLECEGLSVAESDTATSKTIQKDVSRRVQAGESSNKIFLYYTGIYGEYIRLSPTTNDGNWLIYVLPAFGVAVFVAGIIISTQSRFSSRTRMIYWASVGVIFVVGLSIFVHDSQSTKKGTTVASKSTQQLLQEAVDRNPSNVNLRNLAIVQYAQEKYVDALKNFDRAAQLDPSDAASRGYAAYIVFLSQQYVVARQRADEAVAAKGDDTTALFFRGGIYYNLPDTDAAISAANRVVANKDFDKVLELAPMSEFANQIKQLRARDTASK